MIGMKRFIQTAIVISAGFVLWQVSDDARFLNLKEQKQSPTSEIASKPTYKTKTETNTIRGSRRYERLPTAPRTSVMPTASPAE